jgi:hypothetical protein
MQSARCIFRQAQLTSDSKLSHLEVQSGPLEAKVGRSAVWATNNSPVFAEARGLSHAQRLRA